MVEGEVCKGWGRESGRRNGIEEGRIRESRNKVRESERRRGIVLREWEGKEETFREEGD